MNTVERLRMHASSKQTKLVQTLAAKVDCGLITYTEAVAALYMVQA